MGSISTAATTSKPACSKPKLRPPAPANKSIPIGRGTANSYFRLLDYRLWAEMSIGIFPGGPKKERSCDSSCFWAFVWHCQTVSTLHPKAHKSRLSRASFERLCSSFGPQNSGRDLGGRPIRQPWACQKQPFTKIIFRRDVKTISGVPGRSRRCNRYLYPSECRSRRTKSSGAVFFPPMRDINALRLSGDRLSAMVQSPASGDYSPSCSIMMT
jgi:hypothetical protein